MPYLDIAERVPDLDRHRDARRTVASSRSRGLPARARPDRQEGQAVSSGLARPGRERPTDPCRSRERPHGGACRPSLRRRGSLVRAHRAIPRRPVRERARRPAARPAERHPRVRAGRRRRRRDHRREPRRRGGGGRRHPGRARVRALLARGRGPGRRAAPDVSDLDGLRVATRIPCRRDGSSPRRESSARSFPSRARSRPRRGSASPTRSSTSSRRDRR